MPHTEDVHRFGSRPDPFAELQWDRALQAQGLPQHSALFAASNAGARRQHNVVQRLLTNAIATTTAESLVAVAAFMRLAEPDAATPTERVQILHARFAVLGERGLGDYAAFAVSYAIAGAEDADELCAIVRWLEGAEQLGAADELARLCVDRLWILVGRDRELMTSAVLDCARAPRRLSSEYERGRRRNATQAFDRRVDRFLFRHWFLDHACHRIALELDEPYWYFWDHDWYEPWKHGVAAPVQRELEKFANFAVSNLLRVDGGSHTRVIELVNELVERGDPQHRRNAFFLIRHSESTSGHGAVTYVDERFHGALETIATDPRLGSLRSVVPGFIEANLPTLKSEKASIGRLTAGGGPRGRPTGPRAKPKRHDKGR